MAALAVVVVACGPAREPKEVGSAQATVTRGARSAVKTEILGATPKQREILIDALAGVGETKIDVIEVTPAEKGWTSAPDAVGLGFSAGGRELDMRTEWESWLVGQALAVRSSELGLPIVAYLGGRGAGTTSVGHASRPSFAGQATDEDIKRIVQRIEKAARDARAGVDEIEILEPLGLAVAVTLRVSDPARFLDERVERYFAEFDGAPNGPDAGDHYLRVVDEDGGLIMELAGASLGEGSSGSGSVRPDLLGCYDPFISHPTSWDPPPCPTEARTSTTSKSSR
jgi:hypothetical protein